MKLDIITPLYNSSFVSSLLESICSTKYIEDLNIILISDGDNYDYSNILKKFKNLNIKFLSYEKNQGPGIARQYGLNNSNAPFVTFIDSDDIFMPNGIDTIIETIQAYPDKYLYLFDFIENNKICSKIDHFGTMGQVYSRAFLQEWGIKFPFKQTYYLEDYGFNMACMFILKYYFKNEDKIYHITSILAKNIGTSNSITRKNYEEFIYKNWARGSAWNTEYAINTALQKGVSEDFLLYDASKIMSEQYYFYCSTREKHPEYLLDVIKSNQYFYNNCYKYFQNKFGDNLALELWNDKYASKVKNISFNKDFLKFLHDLEKENK